MLVAIDQRPSLHREAVAHCDREPARTRDQRVVDSAAIHADVAEGRDAIDGHHRRGATQHATPRIAPQRERHARRRANDGVARRILHGHSDGGCAGVAHGHIRRLNDEDESGGRAGRDIERLARHSGEAWCHRDERVSGPCRVKTQIGERGQPRRRADAHAARERTAAGIGTDCHGDRRRSARAVAVRVLNPHLHWRCDGAAEDDITRLDEIGQPRGCAGNDAERRAGRGRQPGSRRLEQIAGADPLQRDVAELSGACNCVPTRRARERGTAGVRRETEGDRGRRVRNAIAK